MSDNYNLAPRSALRWIKRRSLLPPRQKACRSNVLDLRFQRRLPRPAGVSFPQVGQNIGGRVKWNL
jgi:hypothetical protein